MTVQLRSRLFHFQEALRSAWEPWQVALLSAQCSAVCPLTQPAPRVAQTYRFPQWDRALQEPCGFQSTLQGLLLGWGKVSSKTADVWHGQGTILSLCIEVKWTAKGTWMWTFAKCQGHSMCNIPMVNLDALQAANYAELPPDSLRISSSSWFCLPLGQAKKLLLQKANCFIPV